jgi:hypothetical protein
MGTKNKRKIGGKKKRKNKKGIMNIHFVHSQRKLFCQTFFKTVSDSPANPLHQHSHS